ncbi:hypothetical protein MKW98_026831 [Papaver atlanticum]|uniref:Uncharacterized protein n=1 Tax=Papaver atlanticum TaxID=357466 RepID=A0AAD4X5L1_9MAGN|nr:hypothetical protein MKW98_026831 [Papaver atlanticum]
MFMLLVTITKGYLKSSYLVLSSTLYWQFSFLEQFLGNGNILKAFGLTELEEIVLYLRDPKVLPLELKLVVKISPTVGFEGLRVDF